MDPALQLRNLADEQKPVTQKQAAEMLAASPLVAKLAQNFVPKPAYAVWRLAALAEIPFAATLPYTQMVLEYVEKNLATPAGFSLYGTEDALLPCYNAMLTEAYCKLGLAHTTAAQNGIEWILKYQRFERGTITLWQGKGIQKYGGCLKETPCTIGIAKAAKALAYYQGVTDGTNAEASEKLQQAMDYVLQHKLYQRLSSGKPFNSHALDLAYPASYQLNIVELLELAYTTGNIAPPACSDAIEYVKSKRTADGNWKINYIYSGEGYISFDKRGASAPWLSYLLNKWLSA